MEPVNFITTVVSSRVSVHERHKGQVLKFCRHEDWYRFCVFM